MNHLAQNCSSSYPQNCDWCPLNCGANRTAGNSGLCGANNYLEIAKYCLHMWEEPPISCSSGSGTIFFKHCSLKCVYCQNFKISNIKLSSSRTAYKISDLTFIMNKLQSLGAANINLVTGTHYRDFIIESINDANLDIPIVWNSSGFETVDTIKILSNYVSIWLTDFKYAQDSLANKYSFNKINNYVEVNLAALDEMLKSHSNFIYDTFNDSLRMCRGIIVRHLLLPGCLENSKAVLKLLYNRYGNSIKYSIMNQYTPVLPKNSKTLSCYPELFCSVSDKDYNELLDYADNLGIEDYYWQYGGAASKSFIPDFS